MDALLDLCRRADLGLDEVKELSDEEFRVLSRDVLKNKPIQHAKVVQLWRRARDGEDPTADDEDGRPVSEVTCSSSGVCSDFGSVSRNGGALIVKREEEDDDDEVQIVVPEAAAVKEEPEDTPDWEGTDVAAPEDLGSAPKEVDRDGSTEGPRGVAGSAPDGGPAPADRKAEFEPCKRTCLATWKNADKLGAVRVISERGAEIQDVFNSGDTDTSLGRLLHGALKRFVEKRRLAGTWRYKILLNGRSQNRIRNLGLKMWKYPFGWVSEVDATGHKILEELDAEIQNNGEKSAPRADDNDNRIGIGSDLINDGTVGAPAAICVISKRGATIRESFDIDASQVVLGTLNFNSVRPCAEKRWLPPPPEEDGGNHGRGERYVGVWRYRIRLSEKDRSNVARLCIGIEKCAFGWVSDRGRHLVKGRDFMLLREEKEHGDTSKKRKHEQRDSDYPACVAKKFRPDTTEEMKRALLELYLAEQAANEKRRQLNKMTGTKSKASEKDWTTDGVGGSRSAAKK